MKGWSLGIDFGTSYTVAASASDAGVLTVDVEGNGRDRPVSRTRCRIRFVRDIVTAAGFA